MTARDLLIGFGMSAMALAAAIWIIVSGGSDGAAVFMVIVSVAVLGWLMAMMHSQRRADQWMARFPGPVTICAPRWQRVLLCLLLLSLAGLIFHAGATGKAGRRDDWEFYRTVAVGGFALLVAIGALCHLPRVELVLGVDGLEFRSIWGRYFYRWPQFSRFYLTNRANWLVCEFAHQSHLHWLVRRGVIITAPLGVSKSALETLLTAWHARALSALPASAAATRVTARDSRRRRGSLLDYADEAPGNRRNESGTNRRRIADSG